MIEHEELIKLLKSYWIEADYNILNGMATDIINKILPVIHEKLEKQ